MTRPTIDETMLATAELWARRATCSRLSVGAVLARDGRVLATAYNGSPAGLEHCSHDDDESCTQSVHAEANALLWAARHGVSTLGATLYVTHAPCLGCSGLIINAGISRVCYRDNYRNMAGVSRLQAASIFVSRGALQPGDWLRPGILEPGDRLGTSKKCVSPYDC